MKMMDASPLISVIVPVYKVEKYLDRCIASIVNQTYKNLEIILVDDGSPDSCPTFCDGWAEKDNRIKVVHKENGGLSDARNVGIRIATGEYISFVDSDDWIEKNFILYLFRIIKEQNCEVVGCNYRRGENFSPIDDNDYCIELFDTVSAMSALIDNHIEQVVWNKLYRRSVIDGILFEKGKYHEDEFWSYQVFAKVKRYCQITYTGYNYFVRSDSIMGDQYSLKRLDAVEAKARRQKFLETEMPNLMCKGAHNLLFTCMYHGQNAILYLSSQDKKEAMAYLNTVVSEISGFRMKDRFSQELWKVLAKNNLTWTCVIRNILRIGL